MRKMLFVIMFAIAVSHWLGGCATTDVHMDEFGIEAPQWTRLLCSFDEDDRVRSVGIAAGIRNPALARVTASNRARAAIDTCLGETEELHDLTQANRIRLTVRTARMVTVELIWRHPVTGVTYALASAPIPATPSPAATEL
ncbi:hypothetical protein HY632_02820 [Candidatus Uhrbacteria bacterium]|nr:hypothetical protein [Candidatus Uhrbacteria bacterium]